ncbi:MAG: DapH/DapD/GlmU-related protein, partial [Aquabacterium sp.]|nr:DapH/DapD/GlmU-related protein [Aquabacterium sp.]
LPKLCYVINRIVFSAVVPPEVQLGKGVLLGYKGLGVIIHRRAVIGNNVLVGAHVTIGGRGKYHDVPVIEDNVMIGTGAKILGPVRIGRGARIGANAVVVHDVPAGATAVGIPASILRRGDVSDYAQQ